MDLWIKLAAFLITWFLLGAVVGYLTHSATLGERDDEK